MRKARTHCDVCGNACRDGFPAKIFMTSGVATICLEIKSAFADVEGNPNLAKDIADLCMDCTLAIISDKSAVFKIGVRDE